MIAYNPSSSNSTFLPIYSTLRNLCICSLLVFVHVLLVTTAVAPREIFETNPSLSGSIKFLSGLSALTLLWKVFILFDLADNDFHAPIRSPQVVHGENDQGSGEGEREVGKYDVFALTGVELGMSVLALAGWGLSLPHAMLVFEVFSFKIAMELSLLPIAYSIVFGSLTISTSLLILQLVRLRISGSTRGIWGVRTGYWERRIKLEGESEKA